MIRETIPFTTEGAWLAARTNDLTSTDIAALFGLSPYKTHFELWHEKKSGERVKFHDNDRVKWGRRLEETVANGIAQDHHLIIRPFKEYVRLSNLRIGSSFDFRILDKDQPMTATAIMRTLEGLPAFADTDRDSILEIKCVDFLAFRDGWTIDEGFIDAPPHIEIQVQHQMLVSGLRRAYIGVMVGGNRIEVLERLADDQVHAGIIAKAREFWQSIDDNNPPEPVMPDDAMAVIRMNQFAEPGKLLDMRGDASIATLLQDYQRLGQEAKKLTEDREVLKADLLQRIGDAEKVFADGFTISAGIVGPAHVEYERAAYRNLRVTPKKVTA